jgi:hypothetical protein
MAAMDRPTDTPSGPPPEPGEPRRRLARPPGERFAGTTVDEVGSAPETLSPLGAAARSTAIAAIGAVLFTVLGGPLSITVGLVAVAAVVGWAIGSFVQPRVALATAVAVASVAIGLAGIWIFARSEGGVLDPITYLLEVHGPLVIVEFWAAAIGAWLAARPASR